MTITRTGVVAFTVAVRGRPVTSAISPRKSPCRTELIHFPPIRTSAWPSTIAKNSRPDLPSLVRLVPSLRSSSSAIAAISPSSRVEQCLNSGILRISAILAFLRSFIPDEFKARIWVEPIDSAKEVTDGSFATASRRSRCSLRSGRSERQRGAADAEREGDGTIDLADRLERQPGEDPGPALVPDRRQGLCEDPELPPLRSRREPEDEGRRDDHAHVDCQ